jgi:decaprenyl-phosphate phosphoribosyltransferase
MVNIQAAIKIARPIHWVKNLSLFAAIIFSGQLLIEIQFIKTVLGLIAFSLATSATYIFNDTIDAPQDRLHPFKKNRPIASGKLSVEFALVEALILAVLSLILAHALNSLFFTALFFYLVLQFFYSLKLKNIHIIDILVIASGFIIRVYAGAFLVDAHLSVWFLLCVISVALFLASGKRRAELNIVTASKNLTRKTMELYKKDLLNSYVTMFGNAAWMSWSLFTFFESPKATIPVWLILAEISRTTTINKLMMITIPLSIFAIMRYQSLIFEEKSESPERLLLTDKPLILSLALWMLLILYILYSGVSITTI